ncbi:DUF3078 domain-containing protein [Aquimarina addita]|uniref:DUF3078 domain-containing protein n=1 Tax=Aquimarina addita TaxID=870485 RepID=A0ABP7XCR6_9FLAO
MMQKIILFIFLIAFVAPCIAQEEKEVKQLDSIQVQLVRSLDSVLKNTPNDLNVIVLKDMLTKITPKPAKKPEVAWNTIGKFSLIFNQSAFNNNWQGGGGTSNIAGTTILNYEFNYKKEKLTWDNKILADFGITFLKGEDFSRKTTDRVEFNTRLGEQIKDSFWNYSLFINFRSQFAKGYTFSTDATTGEIIRTEDTHFFSPAYIQIGPGVLWKKSDNLNINIAPVTSRMIFVDNQFTTTEDYEDGDYFGIDSGKSSRFEFGGSIAAYSKFTILKNITMENILNLYSNYIEEPYNIDIDYTLNLNLVVNKYISGSFAFQTIYDDNATGNFQVREVIGLGLNVTF